MAAITASMVAELRAKTDAPMMECKKALTEADGNFEKAEELLRVKLGSKAQGRFARHAEGVVTASIAAHRRAAELNSSDFVTQNDSFWRWPMPRPTDAMTTPPSRRAGALRQPDSRPDPKTCEGLIGRSAITWLPPLQAFECAIMLVLPARHPHRRGRRVRR